MFTDQHYTLTEPQEKTSDSRLLCGIGTVDNKGLLAMFPHWNLSSNARVFDQADALVVSVPKSGRTWLRVFLSRYMVELKEHRIGVYAVSPVQNIKFTHDIWEDRSSQPWYDKVRGKGLIPMLSRRNKPKVLIVRDPRDLMVSLYFQLTKRSSDFSGEPGFL